MNICRVSTDEWQSRRIKLEASSLHSGECFFDVKSMMTGMPLFKQSELRLPVRLDINRTYPIKQKLSRKPISAVTNCKMSTNILRQGRLIRTVLTNCNNFNATSRVIRPSKISMIASIPCAETNCDCISGVSLTMPNYKTVRKNLGRSKCIAY